MVSTSTDRITGATALVSAAFLYATFGVLIREASHSFSDAAQTELRYALAAAILFVVASARGQWRLPRRRLAHCMALGALVGINVLTFTVAVNRTTLATTIVVLYGATIATSLVAGKVFFDESMNKAKWSAVALALVGLLLFAGPNFDFSTGAAFAALSGLLEGGANTLRKSLRGVPRFDVLRWQYLMAAVIVLPILIFADSNPIKHIETGPVLALVVFAVTNIGVGTLLLYGFSHFDVNLGTVILATEIFFSMMFGIVYYDEIPRMHELGGGLLIFVASALSVLRTSNAKVVSTTLQPDDPVPAIPPLA